MKLLILGCVACSFFVPRLFASVDLFDNEHGLLGGKKVANFSGAGTHYNKPKDKRGEYKVDLKITDLGEDKLHLYWDIATEDGQELYSIVIKKDGELIAVYSPTDKDKLDDLESYKKSGWGYSALDPLRGRLLVFLSYNYVDGNRYDEHFVAQQSLRKKLTISSSGTLGNDKDGMIVMWQDKVEAVD